MIKIELDDEDVLNINGVDFRYVSNKKPTEIPKRSKGELELPECLGKGDNSKCPDYFKCKKACNKVKNMIAKVPGCFGTKVESGCKGCSHFHPCERVYNRLYKKIEADKKDFYKNHFLSFLKTEEKERVPIPVPACFSSKDPKGMNGCRGCSYMKACKESYHKREIAPTCFSLSYSDKSCNHDCSYKYSCKKAFDKIQTAKKISIDNILKSVADIVSKNMKDPLKDTKPPWES